MVVRLHVCVVSNSANKCIRTKVPQQAVKKKNEILVAFSALEASPVKVFSNFVRNAVLFNMSQG